MWFCIQEIDRDKKIFAIWNLNYDSLVVSVTLVYAGVPLGGGVYLHLALDAMLPAPVLADLITEIR